MVLTLYLSSYPVLVDKTGDKSGGLQTTKMFPNHVIPLWIHSLGPRLRRRPNRPQTRTPPGFASYVPSNGMSIGHKYKSGHALRQVRSTANIHMSVLYSSLDKTDSARPTQ